MIDQANGAIVSALFAVLYLIIFAVIGLAFNAWHHHKGSTYQKMLAEYRRSQNEEVDAE